MNMKYSCKNCGRTIERNSNNQSFCKKCSIINKKEKRKKYYQENKNEESEQKKIWRSNNKEKIKLSWKAWYHKNKERISEKRKTKPIKLQRSNNGKKYREKYPEKVFARQKTQLIKIPENSKCEKCNVRLAIHKHHLNYSKPMEIMLLCRECHIKETYGGDYNWARRGN